MYIESLQLFSILFASCLLIINDRCEACSNHSYEIKDLGKKMDNSSLYRLEKKVSPRFYDVRLDTNSITEGNFAYNGSVKIDLTVEQTTRSIILHVENLSVSGNDTRLRENLPNEKSRIVEISSQSYDATTQFYKIHFDDSLSIGDYTLSINFNGTVIDDLLGFYRSSYKENDKTRWLGVTQFSPVYARRAFPCFDEPAFKSRFQLSIGHHKDETVTSNTLPELIVQTERENYVVTKFAPTPRMSTYLLGWSIHNFTKIKSPSDGRFSLWTRPALSSPNPRRTIDVADSLILQEALKIYSALEKWTDFGSPIDKFDLFSVTEFNFDAMENWGFVTFRESIALIGHNNTPLSKCDRATFTLGHELAHTWFGNFVTPSYWNFAWLKEGFATYFSYIAINEIHPDRRMMDVFPVEVLQQSMLLDSVDHNGTMNARGVGEPSKVKAVLDFVTYDKGASIIRMISDLLGDELFQEAMRSYLRENKYKAVTPAELYEHLEAAFNSSGDVASSLPVPLGEAIETWANQPNYPLVETWTSKSGKQLRLVQQTFKLNASSIITEGQKDCNEDAAAWWWIPIKIVYASGNDNDDDALESEQQFHWLGPERTKEVTLPLTTAKDGWYVLNPHQVGYYRVNYDLENWETLRSLLRYGEFKRLTGPSRAALVDDAFNLARAGIRGYELPMRLAEYLRREDDYEPWIAACRAINLLNFALRDRPFVLRLFQRYAIELITPIYERIGLREDTSEDSYLNRLLKPSIISTACSLNLEDCVTRMKSKFEENIIDDSKEIPVDLKEIVYKVGVKQGADDDWLALWKRFLETDIPSEKELMFAALARSDNSSLIFKYIAYAMHPSNLPKQYKIVIVKAVIAGSSQNIETVLDYLDLNLRVIVKSSDKKLLQDILSTISREVTSSKQQSKLKTFLTKNAKLLENVIQFPEDILKLSKINLAWIERCSLQVFNFLNKN